jgi:hypothetical protein
LCTLLENALLMYGSTYRRSSLQIHTLPSGHNHQGGGEDNSRGGHPMILFYGSSNINATSYFSVELKQLVKCNSCLSMFITVWPNLCCWTSGTWSQARGYSRVSTTSSLHLDGWFLKSLQGGSAGSLSFLLVATFKVRQQNAKGRGIEKHIIKPKI